MNRVTRRCFLIAAIPILSQLTGCAVGIIGAGIGAGTAANDQRSTGTFVNDELIELEFVRQLNLEPADLWKQSHVNATSIKAIVLLTGETATEAYKTRILQLAANVPDVRGVRDHLVIAAPSSLGARWSDTLITSKVKTAMLNSTQVNSTRVKVITERAVVYLLGVVSEENADGATDVARRVQGVERVIRLFEVKE
jgi:osmotically-inducible protein OsmY